MGRYRLAVAQAESLDEEHGYLRSWLVSLRQEFDASPTRAGQALAWLTRLRTAVVEHFQQEESGGYFAELVAAAPRLSKRAGELEREHAILLSVLETIVAELRQVAPQAALSAGVTGRFADFTQAFLTHEAAENDLVQSAFEDEPSTAD